MDVDKINFQRWSIILGSLFIVGVILSLVLGFVYVKKVGQCDLNPFVYAAEKTYDQGLEITCTCSGMGNFAPFYFDRYGVTVDTGYQGLDIEIDNWGIEP